MFPKEITPLVDEVFSSDQTAIEKLSSAFHLIAGFYIEESSNDCQLLRATGDKESLVKEQIKSSTISHMEKIFNECYFRATGRVYQEEQ